MRLTLPALRQKGVVEVVDVNDAGCVTLRYSAQAKNGELVKSESATLYKGDQFTINQRLDLNITRVKRERIT